MLQKEASRFSTPDRSRFMKKFSPRSLVFDSSAEISKQNCNGDDITNVRITSLILVLILLVLRLLNFDLIFLFEFLMLLRIFALMSIVCCDDLILVEIIQNRTNHQVSSLIWSSSLRLGLVCTAVCLFTEKENVGNWNRVAEFDCSSFDFEILDFFPSVS